MFMNIENTHPQNSPDSSSEDTVKLTIESETVTEEPAVVSQEVPSEEAQASYDKLYFERLMEKAAAEGADPELLANGKKALSRVPESKLKALLNASPSEFYKAYAEVICSAALDARTNHSALQKFLKGAEKHEGHEAETHGFFYNALRYIAATLLGLVKFAWDAVLITGAFGARFGLRLGKNLFHALTKTVGETAEDFKYASESLAESFDRNILRRNSAQKGGV